MQLKTTKAKSLQMPIIIKKNITSIKEKIEIECKLYHRLNNLFGHRQNIRPTSVLQPSAYEETNNEVLEFVNEVDEQDDLGFFETNQQDESIKWSTGVILIQRSIQPLKSITLTLGLFTKFNVQEKL
jgi:hypothetical protein